MWHSKIYKCVFVGAFRDSTILSFLCYIISSTEAPGIDSSGSKGNSHHAQIKVSSMTSQHEHFSVKHVLSAGRYPLPEERGVSMQRKTES